MVSLCRKPKEKQNYFFEVETQYREKYFRNAIIAGQAMYLLERCKVFLLNLDFSVYAVIASGLKILV